MRVTRLIPSSLARLAPYGPWACQDAGCKPDGISPSRPASGGSSEPRKDARWLAVQDVQGFSSFLSSLLAFLLSHTQNGFPTCAEEPPNSWYASIQIAAACRKPLSEKEERMEKWNGAGCLCRKRHAGGLGRGRDAQLAWMKRRRRYADPLQASPGPLWSFPGLCPPSSESLLIASASRERFAERMSRSRGMASRQYLAPSLDLQPQLSELRGAAKEQDICADAV